MTIIKLLLTYNTKLKEVKSWPVTDISQGIEIHDPENNRGFLIEFGKIPKVQNTIWSIFPRIPHSSYSLL